MKQTKQDVTVPFMDYGLITIPKGTKVTSQTACGYDENYNFVDSYAWIKENYPNISGILKHDVYYHGINIPKEFIEEIN